jgi:hypothetical protein
VPKACRTTAPKVLVYGPTAGSTTTFTEVTFLPTGSTFTVASDATWRAMTTAEFASYDIVVLGSLPSGSGVGGSGQPTAANLQAAFDTRATWGPAITGRVVVLGLDPGFHAALGNVGATTFTKACFSWLAGGPVGGTSLYVNTDWGVRNFDYLSPIAAFTSTGGGTNAITIAAATHPIVIGSTSASLSNWGQSSHAYTNLPAGFTDVADETADATHRVAVARDTACK